MCHHCDQDAANSGLRERDENTAPELVAARRLQEGVAFESNAEFLFNHFYPKIYGSFRRRGFVRQDAEDLAQETLAQAFNQIGSLREPERFRGWLASIANSIFRNELRHRSRQKRSACELSLDSLGGEGTPGPIPRDEGRLPDALLLEKERLELLRRTASELPTQMRQCFKLRFEQGLKYREIAAVLRISIETVKAHLFQTRKKLVSRIEEAQDSRSRR
jgi:RNA polymerase sigma-70 factor (ECF subfamily)